MRRIGAALMLVCLSGVAQAEDKRVDDFFGPTREIRQQAQVNFMSHYLADQGAVQALVDAADKGLRNPAGTLSPEVVRAGVYDAVSVLARVPPGSVTDPALRASIVRVVHAARSNSPDTAALAALIEPRFSGAAAPAPASLPPLAAAPRPAVSPPAQATSADYVITVSELTVVSGVSSHPETDFVSLIVIGPDGKIGPFNWGPQKLSKGDHPNLGLKSDLVRVANSQTPVRISWTAVNHEDVSQVKSIVLALGNAAADLAAGSGNPYTAIPGAIAKVGLNLVKDCDTQLFEGAVVLHTDLLKDGEAADNWDSAAPGGHWRRVFDYPNVASACNTGHYKLQVDVERRSR